MLGRIGSTLGPPEQIERYRRALRIYESEPVQGAIRELAAVYAADANADLPNARDTLKAAAAATGMSRALAAVNEDPDRPIAQWATTAAHSWGDLHMPLSGLMIDNPDNIYRSMPIDGAASYEIHGRVIGEAPTQATFILHEEHSGATKNEKVRSNQSEAAAVSLHDLTPGSDGSFTITADSSPTDGRINHLQTNPAVHNGFIIARDTLADWSRNNPTRLEVRRLAGPPIRDEASDAQLIAKVVAGIETTGRYWLAWARQLFFDRPVNSVTHSFPRVSGWGHVSCGHYQIGVDEALVVHLERRGAAYLGIQVSDVWGQGQGTPYIEGLGSLNASQARPNADGAYTFVIAGSDPGVHNWLDTTGLGAGTFGIRWQSLPDGVSAGDAVRSMAVVKFKDLDAALPAETRRVTPAERAEQLRERRETYQRRLNL